MRSRGEQQLLTEDEATEASICIAEEEWDCRDAEEAAKEDSTLLIEWNFFNLKTHTVVWDVKHGYKQIMYG